VKDISHRGLFVETSARVAPGTEITLVIAADRELDRAEIRVIGRVVCGNRRVDPYSDPDVIEIELIEPGGLGRLTGDSTEG
jgi:hypothetical protein